MKKKVLTLLSSAVLMAMLPTVSAHAENPVFSLAVYDAAEGLNETGIYSAVNFTEASLFDDMQNSLLIGKYPNGMSTIGLSYHPGFYGEFKLSGTAVNDFNRLRVAVQPNLAFGRWKSSFSIRVPSESYSKHFPNYNHAYDRTISGSQANGFFGYGSRFALMVPSDRLTYLLLSAGLAQYKLFQGKIKFDEASGYEFGRENNEDAFFLTIGAALGMQYAFDDNMKVQPYVGYRYMYQYVPSKDDVERSSGTHDVYLGGVFEAKNLTSTQELSLSVSAAYHYMLRKPPESSAKQLQAKLCRVSRLSDSDCLRMASSNDSLFKLVSERQESAWNKQFENLGYFAITSQVNYNITKEFKLGLSLGLDNRQSKWGGTIGFHATFLGF